MKKGMRWLLVGAATLVAGGAVFVCGLCMHVDAYCDGVFDKYERRYAPVLEELRSSWSTERNEADTIDGLFAQLDWDASKDVFEKMGAYLTQPAEEQGPLSGELRQEVGRHEALARRILELTTDDRSMYFHDGGEWLGFHPDQALFKEKTYYTRLLKTLALDALYRGQSDTWYRYLEGLCGFVSLHDNALPTEVDFFPLISAYVSAGIFAEQVETHERSAAGGRIWNMVRILYGIRSFRTVYERMQLGNMFYVYRMYGLVMYPGVHSYLERMELRLETARLLEAIMRLKDAAHGPFRLWERRYEQVAKVKANIPIKYGIAGLVSPPVWENVIQGQASFDKALLRLALKCHHLRHGRYPATLQDLAPDILPSVPRDPYSGKEYGYRQTPEGYELRSDALEYFGQQGDRGR